MASLKFRDGQIIDWTYVSIVMRNASIHSMELTQAIWTEWVNADDSSPFIVEAGGEIIAVANLRRLGLSEWWLEGIVILASSESGEAIRAIVEAAIEKARHVDGGVIRIPLFSGEQEIRPILDRLGFSLQGAYSLQKAKAFQAEVSNFFLLKEEKADLAYRFLRYSPLYRTNRYINTGQLWPFLTEDRLKAYLKEDDPVQILGWNQFNQLSGVVILFPNVGREILQNYHALHVGFISAPDDTTLTEILKSLCGVAARQGKAAVYWQMPLGAGVEKAVKKAGYDAESDSETHIYEYLIR